jgi:hypothetical protein
MNKVIEKDETGSHKPVTPNLMFFVDGQNISNITYSQNTSGLSLMLYILKIS